MQLVDYFQTQVKVKLKFPTVRGNEEDFKLDNELLELQLKRNTHQTRNLIKNNCNDLSKLASIADS